MNLNQTFSSISVSSADGKVFDFDLSYQGSISTQENPKDVDWRSQGTVSLGEFNTFAALIGADAKYTLEVHGSGEAIYFYGMQSSFDVTEPLTFTPSCGWKRLSGGKVSAQFDEYFDFPELFPAEQVDCEYTVATGACGALKIKVDYNNESETFGLNN